MRHALFIADSGPQVGGGHVMRCLTLAEALGRAGVESTFLTTPFAAGILDRFGASLVRQVALAASTASDALAERAAQLSADVLLFDHYGLDREALQAASAGRPCIVIDDLADRPLWADLVIDVGAHRQAADYDSLVPQGAKVLAGPDFALIRPEFRKARTAALRRRTDGAARTVLVSMGLTDVGGVTQEVVRAIRRVDAAVRIEAVIGPQQESFAALEAMPDPRLTLVPVGEGMARRMAAADAAVGAGGGTAWERCVLGLPSVLAVLAENQRPNAAALADAGASLVCDRNAPDFERDLEACVKALLGDGGLRLDLARRSARLCDGEGADRAAAEIVALMRS